MTVIAARLIAPWTQAADPAPIRRVAALARTGGEPPAAPEESRDAAHDLWGLHDPGRPPATIALLAVATVAILALATWLQQ